MSVREDREEFKRTGLQGLLRQLMRTSDEGFIRVAPNEWHGEIVAGRPTPGSGPYIHWRRGEAPMLYRNSDRDDSVEEYHLL